MQPSHICAAIHKVMCAGIPPPLNERKPTVFHSKTPAGGADKCTSASHVRWLDLATTSNESFRECFKMSPRVMALLLPATSLRVLTACIQLCVRKGWEI